MNIASRNISHHELLIRMKGQNGKIIPPGAFLDVAERFGLSQDINRWVIRKALRELAKHHKDRGHRLTFSINLSSRAYNDDELPKMIEKECKDLDIHPGQLVLEITETSAIADLQQAQRFIGSLKKLGFRFSLDDFGVGFSSFHYLKHLAVDYLKIDGSFVRHLPKTRVDQHLIKAMVQVAHGLRKKTIAEFVEDAETLHLLRRYGVNYAQGYFIGRPQPLSLIAHQRSIAHAQAPSTKRKPSPPRPRSKKS
jgi:EAL domain-containing protein (putative c-di-GMP-specific phosphodiesterase class I)